MDDFETWYTQARQPMYSALATWCGDPEAAHDALDEAFVRALERWGRVSKMSSKDGWLWRTATNQVRRTAKRRARELEQAVRDGQRESSQTPETPEIDLRRALLLLTQRQRTAVVLHYIADLPTSEIAKAMAVAPGTVHATLHQARQRLGEVLGTPVVIDTNEPTSPAETSSLQRSAGSSPNDGGERR